MLHKAGNWSRHYLLEFRRKDRQQVATLIKKLLKKRSPRLSVIVVAYDMERELPRTLHSISRRYQQHLADMDYEVLVVDNGSPTPVDPGMVTDHGEEFRLIRIDDASPSPGAAINLAAAQARGEYLGVIVDGARMLTPGVLHWANQAFTLYPRSVVSVLGFHLGPEHQRLSTARGYSQAVEDQLLKRVNWPDDGYKLFEIASLAGSSKFGWYGPIAESNCIFVAREHYHSIGGYEEAFSSPGGGLINLDFYKRVCEHEESDLVYIVGEGCFHQVHGGVTTGGEHRHAEKFDNLHEEYQSIRGGRYTAPTNRPILLGQTRLAATWLVSEGSALMVTEYQLDRRRTNHMLAVGLDYSFHDEEKYRQADLEAGRSD